MKWQGLGGVLAAFIMLVSVPGTVVGGNGEILSDIVVDQTVTFYGRRFYEAFTERIGNSGLKGYGSLVVDERPYTNSGSIISISRNQQVISEVLIFAADRNIDENADMAAIYVIEQVSAQVFIEKLNVNSEPDLLGREFK